MSSCWADEGRGRSCSRTVLTVCVVRAPCDRDHDLQQAALVGALAEATSTSSLIQKLPATSSRPSISLQSNWPHTRPGRSPAISNNPSSTSWIEAGSRRRRRRRLSTRAGPLSGRRRAAACARGIDLRRKRGTCQRSGGEQLLQLQSSGRDRRDEGPSAYPLSPTVQSCRRSCALVKLAVAAGGWPDRRLVRGRARHGAGETPQAAAADGSAYAFADSAFTRSKQPLATVARVLRGMLAATLVAVVVLIVAARSDASPNNAFRARRRAARQRLALAQGPRRARPRAAPHPPTR